MKQYKISKNTQEAFQMIRVYEELRDASLRLPLFGHKKAVKYSKLALKAKRKAWRMVYVEHPELKSIEVTFSSITNFITKD